MKPASGETYLRRMGIYCAEMFPLRTRLTASFLLYISFAALLSRIHHVGLDLLSATTALGIWNVFSVMFILRLMDELKDLEIDRKLFPLRPVPSGRVLQGDIKFTLGVMIAAYVSLNLVAGGPLWAPLVVLGYMLLMFRYFFMPDILRAHLFLNLATHNPVIPILLLSLSVCFLHARGLDLPSAQWLQTGLLVAMYWGAFFAWEVSRKIRSAPEENAYVTYSRLLGRPGAIALAGGVQSVAFGIGIYLFNALQLSVVYPLVLSVAFLVTVYRHALFLRSPGRRTSNLGPVAERYILGIIIAGTIELGIAWLR